jgi:hypothetical protein
LSEKQILMSQAQYARHRNKCPQHIGKLYKAGVLVMRGRLVDAVASDAVADRFPSNFPGPRPFMGGQIRDFSSHALGEFGMP